ncbi:MAG: hypothetical protein J6V90_08205 [Treponema sp.]|nr:hypothetical protein [Treponema sp.]
MSEKEKSVPFTDAQKMLMEAPADDWFTRCKKDFFLKVGRDMVCSEHQELHKRLLSLDPQDWHELNAVKAIFNNGQWLDKDATEAMIMLLTTMYNNPNSISKKTRDGVQSEAHATLFFVVLGVFFSIVALCCLNRDIRIVFGVCYLTAFPVMLAVHGGVSFFLGLLIYNAFFDQDIVKERGFNDSAYNDKILFEYKHGFKFKENVCKNILFPFFDIEDYVSKNKEKFFNKKDSIKKLEDKSFRKKTGKYIKWGVISIVIVTILLLLGLINAEKPLL